MTETSRTEVRVEPCAKRVRTYLGGHLVADTIHPVLVWEHPYYPTYYLPAADLVAKLEPSGDARGSTHLGDGTQFDVLVDNSTAFGAAVRYLDSPVAELRDLVRFDFDAMDAWFEEDEPIYVHPRDPYSRVDILASSRHIRVAIDGTTVADSHNARILFETGLPPRYYLPLTDVRMDMLRVSETESQCPYKGTASYWHVRVGENDYPDIVWGYPSPLPESQKVAGLVCFYNEKVDIWVDGELLSRPQTPFS